MTSARGVHAADALLPGGWARDVAIEWDAEGVITSVRTGEPGPARLPAAPGPVLPGLCNLHSHAFQRVFAGLAEHRGSDRDSFWTWRDRMYRAANAVTPDQLDAIATYLFVEMLEAGFTSVCEFHYLHHDRDGRPYDDPATLATCVTRAAARCGIGLTMLPVLYQQGGFGGQPPAEGQRRFVTRTDDLLRLVERLRMAASGHQRVGLALHSLRAVTPEAIRDALDGLAAIDGTAPVHVHVAEQVREVEECVAWSGQRPVAWLLDHAPVDTRWCLVHATHMDADETARAAASGAVAGLCPTTEANLGDGVFGLPGWTAAGGRWGVGSDSHVTVDGAEELRLLEYSQRLTLGRRNVAADERQPHSGTALVLAAVAGGAAASSRSVGGIAPGQRADLVVLDAAHPAVAGLPAPEALDVHVFASHRTSAVTTVIAAGRAVVEHGRHALRASAAAAFIAARAGLRLAPPA
ncbi:MAG: formimidoylglutamate deiminase [Vicinamibacterales bacterium]